MAEETQPANEKGMDEERLMQALIDGNDAYMAAPEFCALETAMKAAIKSYCSAAPPALPADDVVEIQKRIADAIENPELWSQSDLLELLSSVDRTLLQQNARLAAALAEAETERQRLRRELWKAHGHGEPSEPIR